MDGCSLSDFCLTQWKTELCCERALRETYLQRVITQLQFPLEFLSLFLSLVSVSQQIYWFDLELYNYKSAQPKVPVTMQRG